MGGFLRTMVIRRPAAEVYAFLTDFERCGPIYAGDVGTCESRAPSDTPDADASPVGTRLRVFTPFGHIDPAPPEAELRVTGATPGRSLEIRHEDPRRGRVVYRYTLEPLEGGDATRLTHEASVHLRGLIRRLFTPWTVAAMRRADWAQVERIKFGVESAHAAHAFDPHGAHPGRETPSRRQA